jgi:uncharacterized protein (TIGR02453 family)
MIDDMVSKELFNFLTELKKNNNREWFNAHKERYKDLNQKFHLLVNLLISKIKVFDESLGMLEAKDCTFRIYRDVRFSPDKSPYKTHMGAYMAPGGKKSDKAGYYFHLEPGNTLLAGGLWRPSNDVLSSVRQDIFDRTAEFREIIDSDCFVKHFQHISDTEKLKMPPKGFPKDFSDIELLKHKNFTVMKKIPDKVVLSNSFEKEVTNVYRCLYSFNKFMNRAIEAM